MKYVVDVTERDGKQRAHKFRTKGEMNAFIHGLSCFGWKKYEFTTYVPVKKTKK